MLEISTASNARKVFFESTNLMRMLLKSCSLGYIATCIVCLVVLTVYPVLEILLFKYAVELLVLQVGEEPKGFSYQSLILIVFGTIILYLIKYISRVGRIEVVNKLFRLSQSLMRQVQSVGQVKLSGWARLVLLEVTSILISFLQLISLLTFAEFVDPLGGLIPFSIFCFSMIVVFVLSGREYMSQKKLRYNRHLKDRKGEHQIRSRIKASEWASFYSSMFALAGFVGLLILGVLGYIGGVNVLILSLLIRFSNTLVTNICNSSMRLVRAYVYSENHVRVLIQILKVNRC